MSLAVPAQPTSDNTDGALQALRRLRHLAPLERARVIAELCELSESEAALFAGGPSLPMSVAETMIENAVAVLGVPVGIATNFVINGRPRIVPMAIEEPSVVAAASFAARLASAGGGFEAEADPPLMVAQIQVLDMPDLAQAVSALDARRGEVLETADAAQPGMARRGGGARDLELHRRELADGRAMLVAHLVVDVRDAMGANVLNTMAEAVAPLVERLTGGRVVARILSNLADRRLARATCRVPLEALATRDFEGARIAQGVEEVSLFAEADAHRAVTHNKGILNGIDAVALATGNDWRAIESGAHAWAARSGRYRPLSSWRVEDGHLVGRLELPLQFGTAGASVRTNPLVAVLLDRVLEAKSSSDLSEVAAAVGLAQNLAALRALGSEGIIRGHMALHHRRTS